MKKLAEYKKIESVLLINCFCPEHGQKSNMLLPPGVQGGKNKDYSVSIGISRLGRFRYP